MYLISAIGAFTGFAMVQQTLAFRLQDTLALTGTETAQHAGLAMMASAACSLLMQMLIAQRFTGPPVQLVRWGAGTPRDRHHRHQRAGQLDRDPQQYGRSSAPVWACSCRRSQRGASLAVGPEEQGGVSGLVSACPAAGFRPRPDQRWVSLPAKWP